MAMQRKPSIDGKNLDEFILGAKDEKTKASEKQDLSKPIPQKETDLNIMRRQTYYITEVYIQAINQMAFYEKLDKSEIVRNALEQYIPTKYMNLAVSVIKHINM